MCVCVCIYYLIHKIRWMASHLCVPLYRAVELAAKMETNHVQRKIKGYITKHSDIKSGHGGQ